MAKGSDQQPVLVFLLPFLLRLPVAAKKDSTGICFIGERNFKAFLMQFLPAQPGDMVDEHGRVIGRHDGLMYYTLGQRRGLNIGGRCDGTGESWFVIGKDLERNILWVEQGPDSERLYSHYVRASQATWIADAPPAPDGQPFRCTAKFRYRLGGDHFAVIAERYVWRAEFRLF